MFVITNGEYYIAQISNGLKPVKTTEEAIQFDNKNKANNFMSCMPKTFKNLGYHTKEIAIQKTEMVKPPKTVHKVICGSASKASEDEELQEIKLKIHEFETFLEGLQAKRQECYNQVGEYDRQMVDIIHLAEISKNKNGCEGFKVYALLRDTARKRRKAKNKIAAINAIFEDNDFKGILTQKTFGKVSGLENQVYHVRELDEIFSDD